MQRREDSKLVFFVDVKANNNLTRQAVETLWH
jgi:ribosomal protein L23